MAKPAEVTIPLETLSRLPSRVLRRLADIREEERARPQAPTLEDCVKALLQQKKLPGELPTENGPKQLEWRRVYVAAVGDCHRRLVMGQQRAVERGKPGALVATTKKGAPRISPVLHRPERSPMRPFGKAIPHGEITPGRPGKRRR